MGVRKTGLCLPAELFDRIDQQAKIQGVKRNKVVTAIIRNHFEQQSQSQNQNPLAS